jgi:hypothetical protein
MTSETEHEDNVHNPFLNPIRAWENYLINWIEMSRNFYENAIRTNEQWLKGIWDALIKARNPQQRGTLWNFM